MLKVVSVLGLAMLAGQAIASDMRYSYVESGFAGGAEDYHTDFGDGYYADSESEYALFRLRGSVGFGSFFYLPASLESSAYDYESRFCEPGSCSYDEYSVSRLDLAVGAGLHFPLGSMFDLYGDVSLLATAFSLDEDAGFDDEDEEDDDTGSQYRLGLRFQPADIIEFDLSFKRQKIFDFTADWRALAVQINFTPSIGVGIEAKQESFDESELERDYAGAYFRYSFR